jgi:hypothetical protein
VRYDIYIYIYIYIYMCVIRRLKVKLKGSVVITVVYGVKGSDKTLLAFVHGELNRAGDFEGQRLTGTVSSIEVLS